MSAVVELANWTIANVTLADWSASNVKVARMPDDPDSCMTFYEYDGTPGYTMTDAMQWEQTFFQVQVRAVDYDTARQALTDLRKELEHINGFVGGIRYMSIQASSLPVPMEPDSKDRIRLSQNFSAMKEPS